MPLYLVATPIGNLEDITHRAVRVLRDADLIACEDTRHTGRLLDHFGIRKPMVSYHEHNEEARGRELVERLLQGQSIAIVSDAGTPGISDPAYRIVAAAIEHGIQVIPIPGATAMIAGLVASGLPTDAFLFAGFLPARSQARRARLEELKPERATLILYEAPHRIRATLADCREVLGDRPASLARELTKLHEEFLRGSLSTLLEHFDAQAPRGEITLVIAGNREDNSTQFDDAPIREQIEALMRDGGLDRIQAIKQAARLRGISKREAYQVLLEEKEREDETNPEIENGE
ncbi:MAG: 16S rRNA (cytidine(1402)-2'-O)-methyltransferase [Blastocatellia bacterium]